MHKEAIDKDLLAQILLKAGLGAGLGFLGGTALYLMNPEKTKMKNKEAPSKDEEKEKKKVKKEAYTNLNKLALTVMAAEDNPLGPELNPPDTSPKENASLLGALGRALSPGTNTALTGEGAKDETVPPPPAASNPTPGPENIDVTPPELKPPANMPKAPTKPTTGQPFDWKSIFSSPYAKWGLGGAAAGALVLSLLEALKNKEDRNFLRSLLLGALLGGGLGLGGAYLWPKVQPYVQASELYQSARSSLGNLWNMLSGSTPQGE